MKQLLTGNEAIARGAFEAGVVFASAYPGTPSTEILENMAQYRDSLYCEWSPNEKVALEAAIGASIAGVRAIATMKHVGVNVAADPLFTFAYTGVTGGCVLVSADDPGMHSSQDEQDNRNYAAAARVLMLEPADSQEAKEFTKRAFELSEHFDTPVLLRVTTRICHSKGFVELADRTEKPPVKYVKNISKFVATPANGKVMRVKLEDRIRRMEEYSNHTDLNVAEYNGNEIGVISSGVAYQYAREVFGEEASYLKLGMTFPLPMNRIREFADKVKTLYIVEELDPYIENQVRMAGIPCIGKDRIPAFDELNTDVLRQSIFGTEKATIQTEQEAVVRPPTLCAGCPHRGFFQALSKKKNIMISGDIGCYTLGSAAPLSAMDTCICMGASVSAAHGASIAFQRTGAETKAVAVIGDSTFFHSGITGLMDVVYNKSNCVTVILDNRTTGMTGHQENPGTGYTLMGEETTEVDIPLLCRAIGIKEENIYTVNPLDLRAMHKALNQALDKTEPTVIITKYPCILKSFTKQEKETYQIGVRTFTVDQDKCTLCKSCVRTGCPAIHSGDRVTIDPDSCTGCTLCKQVCPFEAIVLRTPEETHE